MKEIAILLNKLNIDGYISIRTDIHLNEYIGDSDERIRFISGFTGSNATIIITAKENILYTDSRYFIQAKKELKNGFKLKRMGIDEEIDEYIKNNIKKNKKVGIDKRFVSSKNFESLSKKLKEAGIELFGIDDLIEKVWKNQPNQKFYPIISVEGTTGQSYKEKIDELRNKLSGKSAVITEMDAIAWILNLRGRDISYNPLFYSFLYVNPTRIILFIGKKDLLDNPLDDIEIREYIHFGDFIENEIKNENILISQSTNAFIYDKLKLNNTVKYFDDLQKMKSIKNEKEIEGFIKSHIYDGIALCKLFEWIENNIDKLKLTEESVANQLEVFKRSIDGYLYPSFETISAFGLNAAVVHHRPTDTLITRDNVLLIDSGSQYLFGTTDVTRTLHFGTPTADQKRDFTLVLKGAINARKLKFHKSMSANVLDALSRQFLWEYEKDFGHATGHGVGYYLNVHESPPNISPSWSEKLYSGEVFSIEPGYYLENSYGIRIEDLVYVKEVVKDFYKLETLTCVPIQRKMIDVELLEETEIKYLNDYHLFVRSNLWDHLYGKVGFKFMMDNTEPITK
ncbi:Xaa-Pro aminopeptidase 1 [Astathelohania contejeani]|uniref:Xaa-Pro aminopeptidase 1 n=1 Tax=Astathelohania contejeani TaxID=164912 RepID=A0ABQ7HZ32_9MICR|nr:Xaa-Pro aminopeptidase 1 [Thelohania contejeani]